jgi:hypothetical protein
MEELGFQFRPAVNTLLGSAMQELPAEPIAMKPDESLHLKAHAKRLAELARR